MIKYLIRRGLHAVPVLFGVSLITFLLIRLTPGDPVRTMLGPVASEHAIAFWRSYYGLDEPLSVQYLTFLKHVFTLDFGESIKLKAPVGQLVLIRLFPTVCLIVYAVLIALLLAVPLALYSAINANRFPDHLVKALMMVTFAMPAFWLGLVLVETFSLRFRLFPTSGLKDGALGFIWSLTLPAVTLGLYKAPIFIRTLRGAMVEALHADHVTAARARGLAPRIVLRRYVLRNSLNATVTVLGVSIGYLIGGTVIVENVFGIPGIGTLIVGAVGARDFPLIEATTLLIGVGVVTISLLTDLANAALDPRIRQ